MRSRHAVPAAFAVLAAVILCGSARAGMVEYDLTKFKPDEWIIDGAENVRVEADGLHVRVPKDGKPVRVTLKTFFHDEFDMKLEFERVKTPPQTRMKIAFFLENPDEKAYDEVNYHVEWYSDGSGWYGEKGKSVPGCRGQAVIRKDGKDLLNGGGWDHGTMRAMRFVKTDTHVWPLYWVERTYEDTQKRWELGINTLSRPKEEDCDRFRPGFYVALGNYGSTEEVEVVFKKLTVWSAVLKTPGVQEEPKVKRFDFGPVAQQLSEDYEPVTHRTLYNKERGWGWVNPREAIDRNSYLPSMTNEEAVRVGMPPSPNLHYWRGESDMVVNWMKYNKKSYMQSVSHGGDYVEFYKRYMDLKTPVERDLVGTFRPYGFPGDQKIEADQWELRGSIYVDDDLSTEFAVDLPNDRYTLLVGVGYNLGSLWAGGSPWGVDVEGVPLKQFSSNEGRCNSFRIDDVEIKDGQMNLRFYANRRIAMNNLMPWATGVCWHVNYLVVIPSERKEEISAEEWRIIKDRGRKVRQVAFVDGWPATMGIRDGHVVVNGKPFVPMMWQAFQEPGTQRHYPYYLWGNTDAITDVSWNFRGSQHYMKSEWFKMSAADDYPWGAINLLNLNHVDGKLSLIRVDGLLSFMPQAVAGEGGQLEDARGRSDRWNVRPPLNSRLAHEIQREAYTMVDFQLRLHPTLGGHYIYEELWHPEGQGYDWQSVGQYHDWLLRQYGTIEKLNAEWGSAFKDIGEIKPPPQSEESPNWANFRAFRMWAQSQDVKNPCDILKELQPEHTTFGAKGDFPTASWYHAEHLGIFDWYNANIPRAAATYFGKAPGGGGPVGDCYYSYTDGRKQADHRAGPRRYNGRPMRTLYLYFLRSIFEGAKEFRSEEYNDDISHYFHRSKQMKEREGITRRWTGELAWFEPEAFNFAEVTPDEGPLQQTAATAMMYRLAPLLLPAKVMRPKAAILMTDQSFFLENKGVFPTVGIERTLEKLQVPFDYLRRPLFDRINDYQVVILGDFTEMIRPDEAEMLKAFVKKGGKLVLAAPAGARSAIDLKEPKTMPAFALEELAGCTVRDLGQRRASPRGNLTAALPGDASLKVDLGASGQFQYVLNEAAGAKVLAKADDFVLGVQSADGAVVTMAFGPSEQGTGGPRDEYWTDLCRKLFDGWGVKPGFRIEGAAKPTALTCGVLEGKGCWLAGFGNYDEAEQAFTWKAGFLPDGHYEVVDVTGERPDVMLDAKKGFHLVRDPKYLKVEVPAKDVSSAELRDKGLSLRIAGRQGLALLVRPAGEPVTMAARDYTLKTLCSAPVTVVTPDAPEKEIADLAQRVVDFLKSKKVPVELRKASEIPLRKTAHEVWVKSQFKGVDKDYKGYLCDTFNNEVVDTGTHLVVIGSETTNALTRHLGLHDSYVYDKVLFDVDATFPGPGRGVVQTVDSVNLPYYDATDRTRDAILVGGSDKAGTLAAGEAFLKAVADMGEYVAPVREKQLDVLDESEDTMKELKRRYRTGAPKE